MKTKTEQIKLANRAWSEIQLALDNIKVSPYGKRYLALNLEEEKEHRRFCRGRVFPVSAPQAAKLMAVRMVAQAMLGQSVPSIKDILICNASWPYAHSLVLNFRQEIEQAIAGFDLKELAALDYVALMRKDRQ